MRKSTEHQISTGAMADIAFLLLVFFFVAAQIDDEYGLPVTLPRIDVVSGKSELPVLHLHINKSDEILVGDTRTSLAGLPEVLYDALTVSKDILLSEPRVMSVHCDRETTYRTYFGVHEIVRSTYSRIWNAMALQLYHHPWMQTTEAEREEIQKRMPMIVSEADKPMVLSE